MPPKSQRPARPPRILIVDDLFGRTVIPGGNTQRRDLCGQFLTADETGDDALGASQHIRNPVARAVFCRGQTSAAAAVGDEVANSIDVVLDAVSRGWGKEVPAENRWALVLVDLCFYTGQVTPESNSRIAGMPSGKITDDDPERYFGLEVLRALHDRFADLPIVVFSSMPRGDVARAISAAGAAAFLPRDADDPPAALKALLRQHGLIADESGAILGTSPAILLALRDARRAGTGRGHVLLLGERGSGKELFARFLHAQGDPEAVLVTLDCGTLATDVYASELFGHERGAFTGAVSARAGAIERAHGGDLFLDEIGNMPADVQASLLRALESGEIRRLGGHDTQAVDVRVIAATNANLPAMAQEGRFREDLLDRLSTGGTIRIPALRERPEDISVLAAAFAGEAERALPGARRRTITEAAHSALAAYFWPGNVRELRSRLGEAVRNFPDLEYLTPAHLNFRSGVTVAGAAPSRRESMAPESPAAHEGALQQAFPGLRALVDTMTRASERDWQAGELVGALPKVQALSGALLLGLLRAALRATRRSTVAHPEGEYYLQPAMKLLTGDQTLTTARAADLVKRLIAFAGVDVRALNPDDPVRRIADRSMRLRPSNPKRVPA